MSGSKGLTVRPELPGNRLSYVASVKPTEDATTARMEQSPFLSPLTQQARPEVFEPKVVELYRRIFRVKHLTIRCEVFILTH